MKSVAIALIELYRRLGMPLKAIFGVSGCCRFQPTCSVYAQEAIRVHGFWKGTWLAVKRLARCHPWGAFGYDPVPEGPITAALKRAGSN